MSMLTREQVESQCDVLAEVSIDWLVRVAFSRSFRDHDAEQRQTIDKRTHRIIELENLLRDLIREREIQAQRIAELEVQYSELIMAVGRKFPGQTRHQTALRYIQNAERGGTECGQQAALERSKGA